MNNLTPVQLTAMLLRLFGLYLLWIAFDFATYFPTYWMRSAAINTHSAISTHSSSDMSLVMHYIRFAAAVLLGVYLTARPFSAAQKLVDSVLKPRQT
jgi:hypothetical protein